VIVRSGRHCSRTESVTALICSGRNWTEPNTGYSHLLACSSVTYRGRNEHTYIHRSTTLHITLARHWTNRDVSRLQCSYIIREISSENALHGSVPVQKCSETGPKRCCSGRHSTSTRSGTVYSFTAAVDVAAKHFMFYVCWGPCKKIFSRETCRSAVRIFVKFSGSLTSPKLLT